MKYYSMRVVVGLGLIGAGILSLLQVMGWIPLHGNVTALIAAALFVGVGALFLGLLINGRQHWWAIFPGMALIAIGVLISLSVLFPHLSWMGGAIFLGFLGLAFWLVYAFNRQNGWAIIPGGVLVTLALVTLSDRLGLLNGGTLLFLGMAATFGLLYFLPTCGAHMKWAWIPAVVCLGMAALTSPFMTLYANYFWPVLLILLGLFLALRSFNHHS